MTIKELYEAVKAGHIDESKLHIILDNDCTDFYDGPPKENDNYDIVNEIDVPEGNGYHDVATVYALLFPKATVDWC